jgi:hypothetical protein
LVVTTPKFDQGELKLELEIELKLELKLELKPKLPAETRSIAAALSCVGWADATALIAKRAPKAIINAFMNPSIRSVFYRLFDYLHPNGCRPISLSIKKLSFG